jgi:secreted trypsin-like serine protease
MPPVMYIRCSASCIILIHQMNVTVNAVVYEKKNVSFIHNIITSKFYLCCFYVRIARSSSQITFSRLNIIISEKNISNFTCSTKSPLR